MRSATLAVMLVFCVTSNVAALSEAQRRLMESNVRYFNIAQNVCDTNTVSSGSGDLGNVPQVWRDLILNAAPKYPTVDPRMVATVLWVENRGWPEYKDSGWAESSAGARGPFQFIASTWFGGGGSNWRDISNESNYSSSAMGTDGDGDGIRDPGNPRDAVEASFKHHTGSAGLPVAVQGYTGSNPDADFQTTVFQRNNSNLLYFAAKYNGSGAPDGVLLKNFPRRENADYVVMSYWLLATNFDKGFIFGRGFVDAKQTGALFTSSSTPTDTPPPTRSGLYVIGDSLTVGMRDAGDLQNKLQTKGWNVVKINAKGGEPLSWGIQQLNTDRATLATADAMLVGLGTNNIGDVVANDGSATVLPAGVQRAKEQMQSIIDTTKATKSSMKFYWTDFYGTGTMTTSNGRFDLTTAYGALNSALREVAGTNDITILPWSTSTEARSFVPANDVHPNGKYPQMADFVSAAIGAPNSSTDTMACAPEGNSGQIVGNVAWPVDAAFYQQHPIWFTKPHHTYPASDIPVATGTKVYAMIAGTIVAAPTGGPCGEGVKVDSGSGISIVYCHGTDGGTLPGITVGSRVAAGQLLMHSGSTGRSTGPHLHVGIDVNGTSVCPQPLFIGLASGNPPDIRTLPSSGCVNGTL